MIHHRETTGSAILSMILVLLIAVLGGCSGYSVKTIRDEFRGTTVFQMENNKLSGGSLGPLGGVVEFNVGKLEGEDNLYAIVIEYKQSGVGDFTTLRIGPGETLLLLVDGARLSFWGYGSYGKRSADFHYNTLLKTTVNNFSERAVYVASRSALEQIARASSVQVRLEGETGYIDRIMSMDNLNRLRTFLERY